MRFIGFLAAAVVMMLPLHSSAAVKVVASTSDLAYFAKVIGGDLVDVSSVASPTADLHYVEVRPSYMVKLRDADLALEVGLELDMWMTRLIDGSRNNRIKVVDCSKYIQPMEVPTFKPDASYGDLHRFGNPHYWLGPDNVDPITRTIMEGLAEVDPGDAETFRHNREAFLASVAQQMPEIKAMAEPLRGTEIITYHNSWPYFAAYLGIELPTFVEKFSGVAPSPSHVSDVIDVVKGHDIKVIAMEPYFDRRVPDKIASITGAKVIILYPSIGGRNKSESYTEWLTGNIQALLDAER